MKRYTIIDSSDYVSELSHTGGCYEYRVSYTQIAPNKWATLYSASCGCCPYCGAIAANGCCDEELEYCSDSDIATIVAANRGQEGAEIVESEVDELWSGFGFDTDF